MKRSARTRAALLVFAALAAAAPALPAAAQPRAHVTLTPHWRAWPGNQAPLLKFLDSVELWVNVEISPPIGTVVSYAPPPGSGAGALAGLVDITFDITGCDMIAGSWTLSGPGFHGATGTNFGLRSPWHFGFPGTAQPNSNVLSIQPGTLVGPGFPPNPSNPIVELWRGKWDYSTWIPGRTLRFSAVPESAHVAIHYDTVNGVPQYVIAPATVSAGAPVEIFTDMSGVPPCFIFITQHPQDATVNSGASVSFSAGVSQNGGVGCVTPTYQWRRDCVPLSNGPRINGVNTAQLTINPVITSDAGRYDVIVVGVNHSYTAQLSVNCYPNCDGSSEPPILNVSDFSCFLQKFAAGDPYANCDGSTVAPVLNIADFSCFLRNFAAACP